MKFSSILIITYGRSGSTLLQDILNSVDGCLIRGENENAIFHLFQMYKKLVHNKNKRITYSHRSSSPWYGISAIDEEHLLTHMQHLVKDMLLADKISDSTIQCYGFKEIRYIGIDKAELTEYLDFLNKIFPNPAFIFNTCNIDDALKNSWWKKPQQARKKIVKLEQFFDQYTHHHPNCFQICYEDVVANGDKLKALFNFIGANYSAEQIKHILSIPYSDNPTKEATQQLSINDNTKPHFLISDAQKPVTNQSHYMPKQCPQTGMSDKMQPVKSASTHTLDSPNSTQTQPKPKNNTEKDVDKKFLFEYSIWLEKQQAIFVYVPKIACTTWKSLCRFLDGKEDWRNSRGVHNKQNNQLTFLSDILEKEQILKDKNIKKYTFVRNPYSRALSAYKNKIEPFTDIEKGTDFEILSAHQYYFKVYTEIESFIETNLPTETGVNFFGFLSWLHLSKSHRIKDRHWLPQTQITQPNIVDYDFIGYFEQLEQDGGYVLKQLGSDLPFPSKNALRYPRTDANSYLNQYYTSREIELVKQIYLDDFNNFNYDIDNIHNQTCTLHTKANLYGHDADWQYPAITEQHAFNKAKQLLPEVENIAYFGFPWATLIDKKTRTPKNNIELESKLNSFKPSLHQYSKVVTVCQHVSMLRFQDLFHTVGITDIFWAHATKDQFSLPKYPHIRIHPFPLYPVQAISLEKQALEKKYLFSFIGARANQHDLSHTRNLIFGILTNHPKGYIKFHEQWHYEAIVYEKQTKEGDQQAGQQTDYQSPVFQQIMQQSIFALCPSGTGSNSIHLWEAIAMGVIPVVLADTYLPPIEQLLWEQAVIICAETEQAIRALPKQLEKLAQDEIALQRKRQALKKIAEQYGSEVFISDIQTLFNQYTNQSGRQVIMPTMPLQHEQGSPEWLLNFVSKQILELDVKTCQTFLTAFNSYAMLETQKLKQLLKQHPQLCRQIQHCLQYCEADICNKTKQLDKLKNLNLNL